MKKCRSFRVWVLASLLMACDSAEPDPLPLGSAFVLEAVEGEPIPALVWETEAGWSYRINEGSVWCPGPDQPGLWETHHFSMTISTGAVIESQVSFPVECEVEYPNRIRYTYPYTGEVVVGEVWREEPGGDVYQTKRLPSYGVFTEAAAAAGWILPTEPSPFPDPMPIAVYKMRPW